MENVGDNKNDNVIGQKSRTKHPNEHPKYQQPKRQVLG